MNARPSPLRGFRFSVAAFLFSLALPACSSITPNDEPLPSFEELEAIFGEQAVGRGFVREGDNPRRGTDYDVAAEHITTVRVGPAATSTSFTIRFDTGEAEPLLRISINDLVYSNIMVGVPYERVTSRYEGPRGSALGGGRLIITSIQDGRAVGVFAGDLVTTGPVGLNFRIQGSFNAVVGEPEE